jgi:hypothetical protein
MSRILWGHGDNHPFQQLDAVVGVEIPCLDEVEVCVARVSCFDWCTLPHA